MFSCVLLLHQPAVHRDGDHLPRDELPTLLECLFRRQLQPAAAGYKDLYASIDKNIDILEGQIRKTKTKRERLNKEATIRASQEEEQTEPENEIIKELYYEIKPMTPEDAKLKLQENKGNTFLTFVNLENGKVNVIYKLKDNKNYGLIEPEA